MRDSDSVNPYEAPEARELARLSNSKNQQARAPMGLGVWITTGVVCTFPILPLIFIITALLPPGVRNQLFPFVWSVDLFDVLILPLACLFAAVHLAAVFGRKHKLVWVVGMAYASSAILVPCLPGMCRLLTGYPQFGIHVNLSIGWFWAFQILSIPVAFAQLCMGIAMIRFGNRLAAAARCHTIAAGALPLAPTALNP